jgi:hypothetical protein
MGPGLRQHRWRERTEDIRLGLGGHGGLFRELFR